MSDTPQPDWADLLAEDWIDSIKDIYKNQGLPEDNIIDTIVTKQANIFEKVIDTSLGTVDFDSPDYVTIQKLKQNLWHFSAAKNNNDLIALNNLLLDEDGNLQNWSNFKRDAQKVVDTSARYLKTEYNTIVASSQMARLWLEIQRDKAIFPFVQFVVVKDNHTSEICIPLTDVIVSVDDPMLLTYFPPNHFNCRTTVKKLRRATPTKNWTKPDIPEAFKNNPAITGKIFTDENAYIDNTNNDVLIKANELFSAKVKEDFKEASSEVKKQLEEYKLKYPFYQKTDNDLVEVSLWYDANEPRNIIVAKHVANKYNVPIKVTPHTDGRFLKKPNPEYLYGGKISDRKSPEGLNLRNSFSKAVYQEVEVVIVDLENNPNSVDAILEQVKKKLKRPELFPTIKEVIILSKDGKTIVTYKR